MDLRISLQKLEVLSQVVRRGGVGRAADAMFVAQPVVSAHIRTLEERLGAKLFYREGRQIHLTEAGRAVYEWAEDILVRTRELDRYLGGLADGQQGAVALGASMSVGSYLLPHTLTQYQSLHPKSELRLSIADTEHIVEDAHRGFLDFAFVVSAPGLEIPGLEVEQVAEDEIVLVTAQDAEPKADSISTEALSTLPFIEAPDGIIRRTFIDRQLRDLGVVDRNVVLELGHPEAMKAAVLSGAGVSLLFRSAAKHEIEMGALRRIAVESLSMSLPIYLIHRKGKSFSPLQTGLIEAARNDLAAATGSPEPVLG
jgi:DNA-binding transcriptional LysR family regulator